MNGRIKVACVTLTCVAFLAAAPLGCGVGDAITESVDKIVEQLTKIRLQIGDEPEQWRQILLNLQDQVPELSAQLKAMASDLVGRTVDAAQVHAIQGMAQATDFYVRRAQQTIDDLIDARLKEIGLTPKPREPLPPILTGYLSPQLTKMIQVGEFNKGRLPTMNAFGYDMDHATKAGEKISLQYVSMTSPSTPTDISFALTVLHHYECSINLIAVNQNQATPLTNARELRLMWGTENLGAVPVIQLQAVRYEHREVGRQFNFVPPHTRGDADFSGNGPKIFSSAQLRVNGNTVEIQLYMNAQEWDSDDNEPEDDYTTASGLSGWLNVYTAPDGEKIVGIVGDTLSSKTYVDSNHSADEFAGGGGELVQSWLFHGDHSGDDAGGYTDVTVYLSDIRITMERYQ